MVWFFERSSAIFELETRYDNDTTEYVLVLRPPNAASTTERFTDAEAFRVRLQAIEATLIAERWQRGGPPMLLPDGWPDRTPPH
jgi:hypothetical protein